MTKIRLIFKSGRVENVKVDELKVEKREGKLLTATWGKMIPRPLYIDIDELVAIFVL